MDQPQRRQCRSRRPLIARYLLLAMLGAIATCDSLDNVTLVVRDESVVPRRSVLEELLGSISFAGLDNFDISETQEFENQGYSKDQLDSVRLERFSLIITDPLGEPEDINFDFLSSIRFYVETEGLPRLLIAELDPIPTEVQDIDLDVIPGVELQPYAIAPSMQITTSVNGMRPAQETTILAEVTFDVDIAVSTACR
ncbi:MAG: hypothetical protein Tsb0020_27450 [Haliangiales bacterium]